MLAALLLACATPSAEVSPVTTPDASFEERVLAADAIFEGVVESVTYARSQAGEGMMSAPHTFVTWKVENAYKGELPERLTLRFVGGRAEDGRILVVSDMPDFEVGDRDLLLVDGQPSACPLVRCAEGRFHILGDQLTTDEGALMTISEEGTIRPGPGLAHPRLERVKVGDRLYPRNHQVAPVPADYLALSPGEFRAQIRDAVATVADEQILPIESQDPSLPFFLPAPHFGGVGMPDMAKVNQLAPMPVFPPKN